jgi:hypothetical protein
LQIIQGGQIFDPSFLLASMRRRPQKMTVFLNTGIEFLIVLTYRVVIYRVVLIKKNQILMMVAEAYPTCKLFLYYTGRQNMVIGCDLNRGGTTVI